ncbi:MAG: LysE family translocator [Pseudohongiella sp.]|nr:LysE family translocator [Pseudohongiella sp.]MDP1755847.1 LysE family translocator [Pseudohongiella sp.]MDP2092003.1 LysE family translocator [Pseudohongiella sp.]MDP2284804.1 LysE family translocator [Pseudohongiella sp.]
MELTLFLLLAFGLIILPGPNVMVIVTTSIVHGKVRGLQAVAGTSCAMIVQLLVAALGTAWFVTAVSEGLKWLKWLGVVYLFYLGYKQIRASFGHTTLSTLSAVGSFQRGFWVSLTNPKTIFFFSAFLPQFVSGQENYLANIALLSCIFWFMAVVMDSTYALLSSVLASALKSGRHNKLFGLVSGGLFMGAGVALAAVGRE